MRIGYACINMALPSKFKTCRLKTVETNGVEIVKNLTLHNLNEVIKVLEWNIEHQIYFYRLSSEIIPFASHPIVTWDWENDEEVLELTNKIKQMRNEYNMRLTMHPGQYTVLNSPNEHVVKNSIAELIYQQKLTDLVGGEDMILHIGGAYGDREEAKKRFARNYLLLPDEVKNLLRIENDDKVFTATDALHVYELTGAPVCFDIHHHNCNHEENANVENIITKVFDTWNGKIPKMHISSGKTCTTDASHHDFVFDNEYEEFMKILDGREIDLMVEAKRKEQAVIRLRENLGL